MNPSGSAAQRVTPTAVQAAVGLAAVFFPTGTVDGMTMTTRRYVCFVLDGHLDAWSGWSYLSEEDARRFGRLLARRSNQLANAEVAGPLLDQLLMTGDLAGCTPGADYADAGTVIVSPGMPLREFIDATLGDLERAYTASTRCLPTADTGPHYTTLPTVGADGATRTLVDVRYDIRPHHIAAPTAVPTIADAAPLPQLRVPLAELQDIADALDRVVGGGQAGYRGAAVRRFVCQLRHHAPGDVDALTLTAGTLNALIAYTGFGKSVVLVETLACWTARQGLVTTFVVPTNADVVRHAHQIERALEALDIDVAVTPLASPRSIFRLAEVSAHRVSRDGPGPDWIWTKLGYGCALAAAGVTDAAIDAWQPGREPCDTLHAPARGRGRKDRVVACPWRSTCDRFRLARAACGAHVIVTTHANLQAGRVQAPIDDGFGVTDRITVEHLVFRRSHLVVIDEIDSFQRAAINQAGRGLVLDHGGSTKTPLRNFDADFGAAFGRVRDEVDANVRDAYYLTRYLSENYVSHLAYQRLSKSPPGRRPRGPARQWVVPRRWDSWLTARLFDLLPDEAVTAEQLLMFRSLFPDETNRQPGEPAVFTHIRSHLRAVITPGLGGTAIATARQELDHLLEGILTQDRDLVISRLLRRAILERVRISLHRLMANTPQLIAAGVESMQEIADALGPYGRWRATPTGPLGRLLFAFTEHYDDTGGDPVRLNTAGFGGDPHVYTRTLGDTTALAHAGTRRIVLGLSATAYFPTAPHHHVHVEPRWWVSDDNPGSVTVRAAPICREDGSLVRISGVDGSARVEATRLMARLLWTRALDTELRRLAVEDPARARILLATTSYDAARHVAEGLSAVGVVPSRICLAVRERANAPNGSSGQIVTDGGRWMELPANRLEEFAEVSGADILIAPLGRVQRGVNIIGEKDRSALGSIWLIIRPIPLIDDPAELVAHLQAKALGDHPGPADDPVVVLQGRRDSAGNYFEDIVRRPPYFQAQPREVKLGVVAEIINGAIQLIGRARRGGTPSVLYLADGAFLDRAAGADFATLIRDLRRKWKRDHLLERMRELYGTTLEAFFSYADEHSQPDDDPEHSGAALC